MRSHRTLIIFGHSNPVPAKPPATKPPCTEEVPPLRTHLKGKKRPPAACAAPAVL